MINPVEVRLTKMGVHYGLTWRCDNAISAFKHSVLAKLIGENRTNVRWGTHTGEITGFPVEILQQIAQELINQ